MPIDPFSAILGIAGIGASFRAASDQRKMEREWAEKEAAAKAEEQEWTRKAYHDVGLDYRALHAGSLKEYAKQGAGAQTGSGMFAGRKSYDQLAGVRREMGRAFAKDMRDIVNRYTTFREPTGAASGGAAAANMISVIKDLYNDFNTPDTERPTGGSYRPYQGDKPGMPTSSAPPPDGYEQDALKALLDKGHITLSEYNKRMGLSEGMPRGGPAPGPGPGPPRGRGPNEMRAPGGQGISRGSSLSPSRFGLNPKIADENKLKDILAARREARRPSRQPSSVEKKRTSELEADFPEVPLGIGKPGEMRVVRGHTYEWVNGRWVHAMGPEDLGNPGYLPK